MIITARAKFRIACKLAKEKSSSKISSASSVSSQYMLAFPHLMEVQHPFALRCDGSDSHCHHHLAKFPVAWFILRKILPILRLTEALPHFISVSEGE